MCVLLLMIIIMHRGFKYILAFLFAFPRKKYLGFGLDLVFGLGLVRCFCSDGVFDECFRVVASQRLSFLISNVRAWLAYGYGQNSSCQSILTSFGFDGDDDRDLHKERNTFFSS